MATCSKNHLFAAGDALPSCTRDATVNLDVEVTKGRSKGEKATVEVCGPCEGMLRLTTGLKVLSATALPEPVLA